jgi:predicted nucleic acid-binding protein
MKVLDTPVLLELLRGVPAAKALVRGANAEELATTEINLWELGSLAQADPSPGRERRLAVLGRLRRKLVVLPFDAIAAEASLRLGPPSHGSSPSTHMILGAIAGHGGGDWYTTREVVSPKLPPGVRRIQYPTSKAKAL